MKEQRTAQPCDREPDECQHGVCFDEACEECDDDEGQEWMDDDHV
jgi:hypothetical protein